MKLYLIGTSTQKYTYVCDMSFYFPSIVDLSKYPKGETRNFLGSLILFNSTKP